MNARRLVPIALGISAASALAGGVAGGLAVLTISILLSLPQPELELLAAGVVVGCTLGPVLGPPAAFGFLRRVPIWTLFTETAIGGAAGGVFGFELLIQDAIRGVGAELVIVGSILGFTAAAAKLWWSQPALHRGGAPMPRFDDQPDVTLSPQAFSRHRFTALRRRQIHARKLERTAS